MDDFDFEIVAGPSNTPVHTPPSSVEEAPEADQSTKEVHDEPKERDPVQDAARIILKLSLPFTLAWTTFVAMITCVYRQDSDEDLFEHVSGTTQHVFDSYRRRLSWVDQNLPERLEKYKSDLRKLVADAKSVVKEEVVDEPSVSNKLIVGLYFVGIYLLLQLVWPILRHCFRVRNPPCGLGLMPIWIAVACVVRFKKRRRKSSKGRVLRKDK